MHILNIKILNIYLILIDVSNIANLKTFKNHKITWNLNQFLKFFVLWLKIQCTFVLSVNYQYIIHIVWSIIEFVPWRDAFSVGLG